MGRTKSVPTRNLSAAVAAAIGPLLEVEVNMFQVVFPPRRIIAVRKIE